MPYAPGGTADALARLIAQHLGPRLNTTVVVLNKAGASGVIGQSAVAQSAADGYTVLYDATPFSINPHLQKLPYDPEQDLQPVSLVAVTPMLAVVPKNSPYNTLQDLIKAGKQSPGKITFGSGGRQGTVQYMGAELFNQGAGIKALHVPYKSGGPFLQAVMAGEVDFGFGNLPAVTGHVKGGLMKPLAITAGARNPGFPDVPTIGEAAVKGYEVYEWNGHVRPCRHPGADRQAAQRRAAGRAGRAGSEGALRQPGFAHRGIHTRGVPQAPGGRAPCAGRKPSRPRTSRRSEPKHDQPAAATAAA